MSGRRVELGGGLLRPGQGPLELAGLVEADRKGQDQVALVVLLSDRPGQRLRFGQLGRAGPGSVLVGLGQGLDQLTKPRRVVGNGLESFLERGDSLVAMAAALLDRGHQVVRGG